MRDGGEFRHARLRERVDESGTRPGCDARAGSEQVVRNLRSAPRRARGPAAVAGEAVAFPGPAAPRPDLGAAAGRWGAGTRALRRSPSRVPLRRRCRPPRPGACRASGAAATIVSRGPSRRPPPLRSSPRRHARFPARPPPAASTPPQVASRPAPEAASPPAEFGREPLQERVQPDRSGLSLGAPVPEAPGSGTGSGSPRAGSARPSFRDQIAGLGSGLTADSAADSPEKRFRWTAASHVSQIISPGSSGALSVNGPTPRRRGASAWPGS